MPSVTTPRFEKRHIVAVALLCVIIFLAKQFQLSQYLTLNYLHENLSSFRMMVQQHYGYAVFCYLLTYMVATACSIPGSSLFTTAGGMLFGLYAGVMYALIGATVGAVLLFLASRYFIGSWVQKRYTEQLASFNQEIAVHGHHYLLVMRLIALFPFCVINMLSGLTLLPLSTFIWVTIVGLIPVSIVYAYAGTQLATLQSVDDFYSPSVMLAFGFFVLFKVALVPAVFKIGKRIRNFFK